MLYSGSASGVLDVIISVVDEVVVEEVRIVIRVEVICTIGG